jgi:hypothetical protein
MVVHEVEKRVIHRLPVTKGGVHPEVRGRVGQPTCAGAFSLDWIWTEEATHLMLMQLHTRMRLSVRRCVLVITMSLGIRLRRMLVCVVCTRSGVFVPAVFLRRC